MEPKEGIEPTFLLYESNVLPLNYFGNQGILSEKLAFFNLKAAFQRLIDIDILILFIPTAV